MKITTVVRVSAIVLLLFYCPYDAGAESRADDIHADFSKPTVNLGSGDNVTVRLWLNNSGPENELEINISEPGRARIEPRRFKIVLSQGENRSLDMKIEAALDAYDTRETVTASILHLGTEVAYAELEIVYHRNAVAGISDNRFESVLLPGQDFDARVNVSNQGTKEGIFSVYGHQVPENWTLEIEAKYMDDVESFSLEPGEDKGLGIRVVPGPRDPFGQYQVVLAVEDIEDEERTFIRIYIYLNRTCGVELEPENYLETLYVDCQEPARFLLVNKGNQPSNISINWSHSDRLEANLSYIELGGALIPAGDLKGNETCLVLEPYQSAVFGFVITARGDCDTPVDFLIEASILQPIGIEIAPIVDSSVHVINISSYNLTIDCVSLYPKKPVDGEISTFTITVSNLGEAPVRDLTVLLVVDSRKIDNRTIATIAPGSDSVVSLTWYPVEGRHQISIELIPRNGAKSVVSHREEKTVKGLGPGGTEEGPFLYYLPAVAGTIMIFVFLFLFFAQKRYQRESAKREKMRKITERYKQSGEVVEEAKVSPDEYDGGVHVRKFTLPETDGGKPWTNCFKCGAKVEYPESVCPECGFDLQRWYEEYTRPRCVWCDSFIEDWMEPVEECGGMKSENEPCDAGPFCSQKCLDEHKEIAPHFKWE